MPKRLPAMMGGGYRSFADRSALTLSAGVVLLALVSVLAGCAPSSPAARNDLPALAGLQFEDHHGATRHLADLPGSHVALMVGFTGCPDVCPTGLLHWSQAVRFLPQAQAKRLQVAFLTLDPERDTREVLARYVPHFNTDFIGLRADPETQSAALWALRAFARKVPGATPGEYTMDHTATVFVIDKQGNKVDEIRFGSNAATIVQRLGEVLGG